MRERRRKLEMPAERRKTSAGKILCHDPTCKTILRNPDEDLYCSIHERRVPRGENYMNYASANKKGA